MVANCRNYNEDTDDEEDEEGSEEEDFEEDDDEEEENEYKALGHSCECPCSSPLRRPRRSLHTRLRAIGAKT